MFVILEWNQASGQPRVADDTVYHDVDDARADAAERAQRAAPRRERYTVHQLNDDIDEED